MDFQAEALASADTPLELLLALRKMPVKDLESSASQGSRDRFVVVDMPCGLVPLWLLRMGRDDALLPQLRVLAAHLRTHPGTDLSPALIEELLPTPAVRPDSFRRAHGRTLTAVLRDPVTVARHRTAWPVCDPQALLDALDIGGRTGRSEAVAALALTGGL